jgi:hypothetical protein
MSDEIERIRRDHIADPDGDPNDPHCVMCSDASYPIWPCDTALLLALLAERDAEIALLRPLAEYAQHDPGCYALHSRLGEAAACKCGFYEARAALAARGDQG